MTYFSEPANETYFESAAPRVSSVSGVRDGFPTETAPNAPNVPNAGADDAEQLLGDLARFIRRFVVVSHDQADAIALWVVHTHTFDAADTTPYLLVSSAEKRSGKTRLLEVLELLVRRSWFTGRTTAAALVRKVDAEQPTLLLDESDAAFKGDKEYAETLRGVLNTGFRRGGKTTVCVVQGSNITYLDLHTFGPKAIAGIGRTVPDTVQDRGIEIRLERKARTEPVERFRRREVEPEARELFERSAVWAEANLELLRDARPFLPDELDDRAQDVWEPLLAIAELAGEAPAIRAREAAVALSSGEAREDESLGVRLLSDIRRVLDEQETDRIKTADLVWALASIETSPWGNWYGKGITAHSVSKLLKDFRIKTMPVWVEGETVRGYKREQFEDAWGRYLPPGVSGVRAVRPEAAPDAPPNAANAPNAPDDEIAAVLARYPEIDVSGWPEHERRKYAQTLIANETNLNGGAL